MHLPRGQFSNWNREHSNDVSLIFLITQNGSGTRKNQKTTPNCWNSAVKTNGRRWMPSTPHSSAPCAALMEPLTRTAPARPSPSRLTGEAFPQPWRGLGAAGGVAVPVSSPWWPEGTGAVREQGPWAATRHEAVPPLPPPLQWCGPARAAQAGPAAATTAELGEASALVRSVVRGICSASRACNSPLPALQAPSPTLSEAPPALTSPTPKAHEEKAGSRWAAAYKASGRTTQRRGRVVPLLHRRGCAHASISSRAGQEGTRRAEPRSLKPHSKTPTPKKSQI